MCKRTYALSRTKILTKDGFKDANVLIKDKLPLYYINTNSEVKIAYDYNITLNEHPLLYTSNNRNLNIYAGISETFLGDSDILNSTKLYLKKSSPVEYLTIDINGRNIDLPIDHILVLAILVYGYSEQFRYDTSGWTSFNFYNMPNKHIKTAVSNILKIPVSKKSKFSFTSKALADYIKPDTIISRMLEHLDHAPYIIEKLIDLKVIQKDSKYDKRYILFIPHKLNFLSSYIQLYASLSDYSVYTTTHITTKSHNLLVINHFNYSEYAIKRISTKCNAFSIDIDKPDFKSLISLTDDPNVEKGLITINFL